MLNYFHENNTYLEPGPKDLGKLDVVALNFALCHTGDAHPLFVELTNK